MASSRAAGRSGGRGEGIPSEGAEEMEVRTPDWSRLPSDLVGAVARKITAVDDYVRFRAVCRSWRSAASARPRHLPTQLPWLMLPYRAQDDKEAAGDTAFFSVPKRRRFYLPSAGRVRFCGSSHGWLLTVEDNGPGASLLNPITGAAIPLPPLTTLVGTGSVEITDAGSRIVYESYIEKIVLSADPAVDRDTVVMGIHGSCWTVAFCRIGDDSWRWIDSFPAPPLLDHIDDIAYHRGQFYCIFHSGCIALCDLGTPASFKLMDQVAAHVPQSPGDEFPHHHHLVVSTGGDLLSISHFRRSSLHHVEDRSLTLSFTDRFEVFRLELSDCRPKVSKLKSIGDDMLFLGPTGSIAISAVGSPGYRGNRIYIADSNWLPVDDYSPYDGRSRHDIFVFNLRDGKKKLLRRYLYDYWPWRQSPLWFTPSLRL